MTNKKIMIVIQYIRIEILIFLFIAMQTSCSRKNIEKNPDISQKDLRTGSGQLKENFEWDALKARDLISIYTTETGNGDLFSLYKKYDFEPVWMDKGSLSENSQQLIQSLRSSWKEGLSNEKYEIDQIYKYIDELEGVKRLNKRNMDKYIHLDVLLSNAYLSYASYLLSGRVNPDRLDSIWEANPRHKELIPVMENALEKNKISRSLEELKPEKEEYMELSEKLRDLMIVRDKGGWPLPGYTPVLQKDDSNKNVISLKKYLRATGDLTSTDSSYINSALFDNRMKEAVIEFQERHGLTTDGIVGEEVLNEMNKPVEYRIKQVKVNLERIRWLPADLGQKYILLNIPEFRLRYYENNRIVEDMKVVVGEIENYTPILKDTLRYIVFNPTWNVPRSIAVKEMLPKIKKDTGYLERNNYLLLKDSYESKDTINPDTVDWKKIDKENFSFFIVEKPGDTNSLGRVKFLFPNYHAIYLHDTPAKHLFDFQERDFSHGCIRLSRPFELAEEILDNQLSRNDIRDILKKKKTETVVVNDNILVHFLYRTAWVDDSGRLQFRNDLYRFDEMTAEKL